MDTKNGKVTETIYKYDENNRLTAEETGSQPQITYEYDNNGNMNRKSDGMEQTFDAANRMIRFKKGNRTDVTYTYYPDDIRQSKKVGTAAATTHV